MTNPKPAPRPIDPRAGKLCTACNKPKTIDSRDHCENPACTWWRCRECKAVNDATGSNDLTNRDGAPRSAKKAS